MTPRTEFLQRIVTVSVGLDSAILENFFGQLEALPAAPGTEHLNGLTSGVDQPEARAVLIGLVKKWRTEAPDVTPSELAWAIRAGNSTDEFHRARQSLEIVWTGPASNESTFRRTGDGDLRLFLHWLGITSADTLEFRAAWKRDFVLPQCPDDDGFVSAAIGKWHRPEEIAMSLAIIPSGTERLGFSRGSVHPRPRWRFPLRPPEPNTLVLGQGCPGASASAGSGRGNDRCDSRCGRTPSSLRTASRLSQEFAAPADGVFANDRWR